MRSRREHGTLDIVLFPDHVERVEAAATLMGAARIASVSDPSAVHYHSSVVGRCPVR
jgi:hypothetical protein